MDVMDENTIEITNKTQNRKYLILNRIVKQELGFGSWSRLLAGANFVWWGNEQKLIVETIKSCSRGT